MSKRTKPKPNYATIHFPPRHGLLFRTAHADYIVGEKAQYSPITGGVIIERGLVREQTREVLKGATT